jgi:hypothetical protein
MYGALSAVTNLLQEFADDEMKSRTTPILGGDDENIAKMESRMTPIQEGEDDECNGTVQIIRAQVQKQSPKRSNSQA